MQKISKITLIVMVLTILVMPLCLCACSSDSEVELNKNNYADYLNFEISSSDFQYTQDGELYNKTCVISIKTTAKNSSNKFSNAKITYWKDGFSNGWIISGLLNPQISLDEDGSSNCQFTMECKNSSNLSLPINSTLKVLKISGKVK